jgi:protein-disulfide isomerase
MENNSKLSTPVAILIVGVIIAGAIIFTKGGNTNNTQTAAALIASADIALKPVTAADDHILGNPNSDIKVIQYSDTECPFCKRYHEDTTLKIESDYVTPGKLSLTYRPLPLVQLHSKSKKEAEALECANELGGNDKFWQYLNKIFEITPSNDGLDPAELPKIAKDIGLDQ